MDGQVALDKLTQPVAALARSHPSGKLMCVACAHRCKLGAGKRGGCRLRFNDKDQLRVPWGYTAGMAVDPVEKKPFFHVCPGSGALSFGMLGCNLHCAFCQNWHSSQSLRDPGASVRAQPVSAGQVVQAALRRGCRSLISTYNEPLISAEWAHEIFSEAKRHGLLTGVVSNGQATEEVLAYLGPQTDLFKVDLKTFSARSYRKLGGRLEAVTDTIKALNEQNFWVEVVTLVVPGFNDDPAQLADIAAFLAGVGPGIPWHVTAFHPDYGMTDRGRTPLATIRRAREIGLEQGLEFVYAGNLPGASFRGEDTRCPDCSETLIERHGFMVMANRLGPGGACPKCGRPIPGVWSPADPAAGSC